MIKFHYILLFFLIVAFQNSYSQISAQDSLRIKGMAAMIKDTSLFNQINKKDSIVKPIFKIIPKVATRKSAILPGWGQIYINQKWFVPVIYGGFVADAYFIIKWGKKYRAFRNEYFRVNQFNDDIKPNDILTKKLTSGKVALNGVTNTYSIDYLKQGTDFYRKNRDVSWMILPVIWAANVLEVNVAAHLKSFDMSDDISMKIQPNFEPNPFGGFPTAGGKIVFAFK
jgi:Family of unknown function (DUF5683)